MSSIRSLMFNMWLCSLYWGNVFRMAVKLWAGRLELEIFIYSMHFKLLLWIVPCSELFFDLNVNFRCSFHLPSVVDAMVSWVGCSTFFLSFTPFFASALGLFFSKDVGFFFSRELGFDRKCREDTFVENFGGVGLRESRGCECLTDCFEELRWYLAGWTFWFLFLGIIQINGCLLSLSSL